MKHWLTPILLLVSIQALQAQASVQLAFGVGFDVGVNFIENKRFVAAFNPNNADVDAVQNIPLSIHLYTRIPLKHAFNLCPTLSFSVAANAVEMYDLNSNPPYGNTLILDYQTPGFTTSNYLSPLASGTLRQTQLGVIFTKHIWRGFEVGAGVLMRTRTVKVSGTYVYDTYVPTGQTPQGYNYVYSITNDYGPVESKYRATELCNPVVLQYTYNYTGGNIAVAFIRYLAHDDFSTLRLTMAFDMFKMPRRKGWR